MATSKQLETWLKNLQGTTWFEQRARTVFDRIVHGRGNGLMILQGPSQIANKSYFLNMVKAFQKGVPELAKASFSEDMHRLLEEVDMSQYQCVDISEEYPESYAIPLCVTLPLSIASASYRRGLKRGYHSVVLCDNLNEFINHDASNITFLHGLSRHGTKDITFLGAYTVNPWDTGDGLKTSALATHVMTLGYD